MLVALAGLSPQVVTETLYALLREGEVPGEVHVLTTLPGRHRVLDQLLDPHRGAFFTLCGEWQVDHRAIRFDRSTIHLFTGADGQPIEDLRTAEESAAMADQVAALVRGFTADPETRVHASLAGGRKTMTFYLGYALSLFGRPQDRLSHVLVPEDFESHPDFFYPPREPRQLRTRSGKWIDTRDARVDLVDLPFLRLRDYLPAGSAEAGFAELIRGAQEALAQAGAEAEVRVGVPEHTLACGSHSCRLRPQAFAVWLHLALTCQGPEADGGGEGAYRSFADLTGEPFAPEVWNRARGTALAPPRILAGLEELVEQLATSARGDRNFVAVVSKINRTLDEALPPRVADALRIRGVGRSPVLYGVSLAGVRLGFAAGAGSGGASGSSLRQLAAARR